MEPPPIRAELRVQTICLATLTVVAVAFALSWLRPVMIPFVVAAFLAFALRPLVDCLETYARLSRTVSACAALLLAVLALLMVGWLVAIAVAQISKNSGRYEDQVDEIIHDILEWPPLKKLKAELEPVGESAPSADSVAIPPSVDEHADGRPIPAIAPADGPAVGGPPAEEARSTPADGEQVDLKQPPQLAPPVVPAVGEKPAVRTFTPFDLFPDGMLQSWFWSITGAVTDVIKQSAVVLIFLFFLLLSSVRRDHPIGGAWGEMESQIRAYLVTMTVLSAVCGVAVWLVLAAFAIPMAVLFGLLTFLLNFIPNVGSFVATIVPLPVIWMSPQLTLAEKIVASVIPAAIQFVVGNFVQPKVMGSSMKLHPVVILMALIFWGMLWGIVGMFLAVPITSIIRIACDRHDLTKPVADLMAGNLNALRGVPPAAADGTPV